MGLHSSAFLTRVRFARNGSWNRLASLADHRCPGGQNPNSQMGRRTAGRKARERINFLPVTSLLTVMLLIVEAMHAQVTSTSENLLTRAIDLENNKDYAGAEEIYKQLLAAFPDQPEILSRLGVVCQHQLKYQESIDIF